MLAVSVALSLSVWDQTGRKPDTRGVSPELEAMKAKVDEAEDPFAELGMDKPKEVDTQFRLGLIPGFSSTRDAASVATLAFPSFLLTVFVFAATRRQA
jgi:hypothetical protein